MSFLRSLVAFLLLLTAVGLGFGAMGAHWLDRLARTPAPLQQIVGPLMADDAFSTELAALLVTQAQQAVPESMRSLPIVGEQVDAVVTNAVNAAFADPGAQRAWHESINRSRVAYIAELDKVRSDESMESPTIWLNLTPLLDLGRSKLKSVTSEALHSVVDQIQFGDARLPLGQPPAGMSQTMSDLLGSARNWPLLYLGAGLFVVAGLVTGTRRGRWVALALAGIVAAVVLGFSRSLIETLGAPSGTGLAAVIRNRIVDGGAQSLLTFTQPGLYAAYGAIALGVIALILRAVLRRR